MLNVYHLLKVDHLLKGDHIPTTKSLAFAKFIVKDKHLINGNLSNMTEMSSSNNFWSMKINHSQVVIVFKTK